MSSRGMSPPRPAGHAMIAVVTPSTLFRASSAVGGVVFIVLTVGFLLSWDWVTNLWPFILDETRLGHLFLASIALAIGLPAVWIAATGSVRSAASGTIDLVVMFGAMTWYLLSQDLTAYAIGTGLLGVVLLGAFAYSQREPWTDDRPMPRLLLVAFVVFAFALVAVGTQLVRQSPHIFPWPLAGESSVMYGFIFYGAAVYFVVGALERRWAAAAGQLIGFLAYDLVLIGPFLARFDDVPPDHRPSLVVYTAVLVVSGALAAYYLFVDRRTRIMGMGSPGTV